jgi:hypothetical protein
MAYSDCLHVDTTDADAWHRLGCVLAELRLYDESGDCLSTAARLHARAPLLPFAVIPRTLL